MAIDINTSVQNFRNKIENILSSLTGRLPIQRAVQQPQSNIRGTPDDIKITYGKSTSSSPQNFERAIRTQPVNEGEIERKIRSGFKEYSKGEKLPIEEHIPTMVAATRRYPIFQKYPYLIPAVSIVETSGGRNYQLYNNPLSWAARVQVAGGYNPKSVQESIEDFITAVGGDASRASGGGRYLPGSEIYESRKRQPEIYKPFRETGDVRTFAKTYETPQSNPNYERDLLNFIQMFERQ